MKNRSVKIITLVLSCLLLIGAMVGIIAAAENSPSVTIAHKNLSYEGATKILYAVKAENIADDQSVVLYFYDTKDATEPAYKKGLSGKDITLNGETYDIVFSNGIAPSDMRKTIYVKAAVENADGSVAYLGETVEYSIYQYVINRFSKRDSEGKPAYSEDQLALYSALLEYGADVQKVLLASGDYKQSELDLAGGYANEYYIVNLVNVVDGVASEVTSASFSKKEALSSAFVLEADKVIGDAYFAGFTDAYGKKLQQYGENTSVSWNKLPLADDINVGVNEYALNYITDENAKVYTYDESENTLDYVSLSDTMIAIRPGSDEAMSGTEILTTDKKGVESTTVITNKGYVVVADLNGEKVLELAKIVKVLEGTVYPEGYEGDKSGAWATGAYYGDKYTLTSTSTFFYNNPAKDLPAAKYVYETDFYIISGTQTTILQLDMQNQTNANMWGINVNYNHTEGITLSIHDGEDNAKVIKSGLKSTEWHNLRVEYTPDLTGNSFDVKVYVNGEFTGDVWHKPMSASAVKGEADREFGRLVAFFLGSAKNNCVFFDNTMITTEYAEYSEGKYANNEKTNTEGEILSTYTSGTSTTFSTYTEENGNKALRLTRPDSKATTGSTIAFHTFEYGTVGTTYVFEADIKWLGTTNTTATWGGRIGFISSLSNGGTNDAGYIATRNWQTTDGRGIILNSSSDSSLKSSYPFQNLYPGSWYNFRYEFTITGDKTGVIKIYYNNVCVLSYNYTSAASNSDLINFSIWFRGCYAFDMLFDNIYIGAENPAAGYSFDSELLPKNWSPATSYNIATETVVNNPLATDPDAAADKVLKIQMNSTEKTYDSHTVTFENAKMSVPNGTFELSYDFYYDGELTLPKAGTTQVLQTIIPIVNSKYLQLVYFRLKADGKFMVNTTTGESSKDLGDKGIYAALADNIVLNMNQFNNIKFVFEAPGTLEDTTIEVFINGVSYGKKVVYHNTTVPTFQKECANVQIRFNSVPRTVVGEDETTTQVNDHAVYIDNFVLRYLH